MDAQERDPAAGVMAPDGAEDARLEAARRRGLGPLMLLVARLRPDAPEVGGDAMPREEPVRLRHDPWLVFHPGDVSAVRRTRLPTAPDGLEPGPEVVEITTTFLGLTGAVSPLPGYLAEEVAKEVAHEADEPPRQREFLDLFHHRILSLFHRAATVHDPTANHLSDQSDAWSRRVLALAGLDAGAAALPNVERWRLLRWAPLLGGRAMTAAGLEAALADLLSDDLGAARVAVEQFVGTWAPVAAEDRTRLGVAACELGKTALLGSRVYDRAGKFRVVIGPLDRAGYARFSDPALQALVARAIAALAGDELERELVLWLGPDAAPRLELSSRCASQLGRNAWLGRQATEARFTVAA
ncbi:type VI secretion system baseplate subunit TssG [Anaeromyxobacter oryzisoli]|uniref:type VI secretion system baseplate subunit TssG n=1 Tax=Anaeromyxobacter oryzisoli TaxID=2925408 RepID=UPI001F568398|nr:type VI secretion system baseplate subunit TssG [Anaeromyxobacter sp. SG63]